MIGRCIFQGKSLSIICGALCWLKDHLEREKSSLTVQIEKLKLQESKLASDGDWITGQSLKLQAERERRKLEDKLNNFIDHEKSMKQLKERVSNKVRIRIVRNTHNLIQA